MYDHDAWSSLFSLGEKGRAGDCDYYDGSEEKRLGSYAALYQGRHSSNKVTDWKQSPVLILRG